MSRFLTQLVDGFVSLNAFRFVAVVNVVLSIAPRSVFAVPIVLLPGAGAVVVVVVVVAG
jgi:hypothetical protein